MALANLMKRDADDSYLSRNILWICDDGFDDFDDLLQDHASASLGLQIFILSSG